MTTGFTTNRSLDPVDQVVVGIDTRRLDEAISTSQKGLKTLLYLGPLPPRSRVTVPAIAVKHALVSRLDIEYKIVGVSFVDVYGQRWARISSGPLQPLEEASSESRDPFQGNVESIWKALSGGNNLSLHPAIPGSGNSHAAAPKSLKDCGAEK
ncbi:hypothetical protein [Streptomyces chartreusis]